MAKSLFIFLFFSFSFLFLFGLTTQERSMEKYYRTMSYITVTCQDITGLYHIIELHDECGKVVHRPYSSCISSVQNLMGTPLSFPCQLRLEVVLRHLSLSSYSLCNSVQCCLLDHCALFLQWSV